MLMVCNCNFEICDLLKDFVVVASSVLAVSLVLTLYAGICHVALKRRLLLRRSVAELADQGIYPRKLTLCL